ncbi:DgyrCDS13308 [Dimorphilus gyrociliatus]|nr:DgyrCDS13308 [Dimorphilus gyrociliatus]
MTDKIWIPDTYILNGQGSYLHTITYSNKLFRINASGDILYSQRLTIKSKCIMNLEKYPMDKQNCPLWIGSYGYGSEDVLYEWENKSGKKPVANYKDIKMAQFKLTEKETGNMTSGLNHGNRKIIFVVFKLRREIGFLFLQIYLPCYLIVIISWVSFWINREATPARVTLGTTTLLTTCTIGITGREGIPKVSYSTALDIFLVMCFCFVFAALVEYAGVNYFTKGSSPDFIPLMRPENRRQSYVTDVNGHAMSNTCTDYIGGPDGLVKENCWVMFLHCLMGNSNYRHLKAMSKCGTSSVSRIDSMARILFPFSFVCLNILYWAGFLYYF